MKLLFNDKPKDDVVNILNFIQDLSPKYCDKKISIDTFKIEAIIQGLRIDFKNKKESNKFKQIASFMAYFVAERPIYAPFEYNSIPDEILAIPNYENAMIALLVGLNLLNDTNDKPYDIDSLPVSTVLSEQSFINLIGALSDITPQAHFKLLAVLLEQLAYIVAISAYQHDTKKQIH